jgi:hypothetical protein
MARVNICRRLATLENQCTIEPIVLQMPEGRTVTLPGRGNQAGVLLGRAVYGEPTPEIRLIAQSVSSIEPGGGHLIDLARAILNSPV